jgi:hypothetical protein
MPSLMFRRLLLGRPALQGAADPVERIALTPPVAQSVLLDPAAHLIDHRPWELDDMERVQVTIPEPGGPVCDHMLINPERFHPVQPPGCGGEPDRFRPDRPPHGVPGNAELMRQRRHRGIEACQRVRGPCNSPSAQRHTRLAQIKGTGLPKHGMSCSRTGRRPWPTATTPTPGTH